MIDRDRIGGFHQGADDLDEYLRNEYRAEEGAYMERRPGYARYGEPDREPASWGPRLPGEYYGSYGREAFAGAGMTLPRDEPLYRDESGFERGYRESPAETWRYRERGDRSAGDRGMSSRARHRDRRDDTWRDHWQQDREGGRRLAQAAEHFYENLAGAVGLGPHEDRERGHRGRGPRNYRRSDERILDEIGHRFTEDGYLDASDIEIDVGDQEVTLSGSVKTRFEKRHAEDIAEAVSGVRYVQNNLRINASGSRSTAA